MDAALNGAMPPDRPAPETGEPLVAVAANLRRLRVKRGLSLERLAQPSGVRLFPAGESKRAEFYELRLKPSGTEHAPPHPAGTTENLVVASGAVEIEVDRTLHRLDNGDAIFFTADVPHVYRNVTPREAVMYLVMTYAERVG